MTRPATVRAGRREVEISSPGKVLFGRSGLTKLDLARYYAQVAGAMVPHTRDRPLSLKTYPRGIDGEGVFIKNAPRHFPAWIRRATVGKRGGTVRHPLANDRAALAYLAGQNMIEPHVWTSRIDLPERPDRLIVDLDPGPASTFADVRAAARAVGDRLRDAGLVPFAMTTGSRGIHVVAPLRRTAPFPAVFAWAKAFSLVAAEEDPAHLTTEFLKRNREGRIFIDVLRNRWAQTAVAPYGARAREGAPVATPLRWDELSDRRLAPDGWTIATVPDRVGEAGDPWAAIGRAARSLPRAEP